MLTILTQLFRNWWHFAVRGLLAIVFGIMALIWPETTKLALVLLFGAFALVDGIFAVTTGIAARGYLERWWAILLEGITGIIIAVLTFFWPNITAFVLLYFIAAWAVTTGIFEILAAIEFRHVLSGEWAMILVGLLSVIFGVLLFVFPGAGALSIVWLIGMYAIAAGIMEIIFAFRLHSLGRDLGITGTASA
ncbi:MAG TPA: HdeD family acid-resistance protein [Anaerolineales bacterium]|nr:HdeD family acid-resistance protein [Anaerolineales bacterium]